MLYCLYHKMWKKEADMNITCKTVYDQKTMTDMATVLRRTIRKKRSRLTRLVAWGVMALCLLSAWIALPDLWLAGANLAVAVLLLLVQIKEDALNAFFARRKAIPGMEKCTATFYPDHFETKTDGTQTAWQYDKILILAETKRAFIFVMGNNHAQAHVKAGLEGTTVDEFRSFLTQKTGKSIQRFEK